MTVGRVVAGALVAALLVAGCGLGGLTDAVPSPPSVVQPSLSPTLLATRSQVIGALSAAAIQARDSQVAYRPGESALVAAAPRTVVQAIIPAAPSGGLVVIYEFIDAPAAAVAGQEWAGYIASGIGRIQFPTGSVFTIRQLGSSLVFHAYDPQGSPDPDAEAAVAAALATIGIDWPVSS